MLMVLFYTCEMNKTICEKNGNLKSFKELL